MFFAAKLSKLSCMLWLDEFSKFRIPHKIAYDYTYTDLFLYNLFRYNLIDDTMSLNVIQISRRAMPLYIDLITSCSHNHFIENVVLDIVPLADERDPIIPFVWKSLQSNSIHKSNTLRTILDKVVHPTRGENAFTLFALIETNNAKRIDQIQSKKREPLLYEICETRNENKCVAIYTDMLMFYVVAVYTSLL